MDTAPSRFRCAGRHAPAALALLAAALAAMGPVLADPARRMLGWPGDNQGYVYLTGRAARALAAGESPLLDPRISPPDGLPLLATDAPYSSILLAAPLALAGGPVLAYNAVILASHFLSGLFTYLWIRRLTGSRAAGVTAGLAFMLAPFRIAHSYGHLQIVSTQGIPLFFWALEAAARAPRSAGWRLVGLGGATLLLATLSQYYLIICLATGGLYAALRLRPGWCARLMRATGLLAATGAGAVLGSLPYLFTAARGDYRPYAAEGTRAGSAALIDFIIPSHLHPLWGAWVHQRLTRPDWVEHLLYPGLSVAALALVGLVARRRAARSGPALAWAATAVWAGVLALGTDLHIGAEPLSAENPVWLPAFYLGHLPPLNLMRVWGRFGIVTLLMISLLAGLGAAALIQRARRSRGGRWAAGALCLLAVAVELAPGNLMASELGPRPIDRWLADRPGSGLVAFLPSLIEGTDFANLAGSLHHSRPMLSYSHGVHLPRTYAAFADGARTFPSQPAVEAIRALGVRLLILNRAKFDGRTAPAWEEVVAFLAAPGAPPVAAVVDRWVVLDLGRRPFPLSKALPARARIRAQRP